MFKVSYHSIEEVVPCKLSIRENSHTMAMASQNVKPDGRIKALAENESYFIRGLELLTCIEARADPAA